MTYSESSPEELPDSSEEWSKLPRTEPILMFLVGFRGSKELQDAEDTVSKLLVDFPGSSLLIYDQLDPQDPNIEEELSLRGIESLPHLAIIKDEEYVFSYCDSFDETLLAAVLSDCFLPADLSAAYLVTPCEECLNLYQELIQAPDSSYLLSLEPVPTLVWSDEHPGGKPDRVYHRQECKDWMHDLQLARNYLWEHGSISEKHEAFWELSQQLIPSWPGFNRLALTCDEMESYLSCIEENNEIFNMVISRYNAEISYRCTGYGFLVKGFVCKPTEGTGE